MNTLMTELNNLFKNDEYFTDENGELLKEKVKTAAISLDEHLLDVLIGNEKMKKSFFKEKNGILVFDKVKFSWVISNTDFLPDSFTSFKNKIGLVDSNGDFLKYKDDVTLAFPYKDCILEFDSTDENEKRDEVFLNETLSKEKIDVLLSPKAFGNSYNYKSTKMTLLDDKNENFVIKGNNLIVLNSLLEKYTGKIKMMYWDILYNTSSDSVPYNDSFKHSSWLTMMKNRIEVAKRLLNPQNGFMLIQCDKNEDSYLTVLTDEIFGREKHICNIAVKSNNISGNKTQHKEKTILKNKDSILVYSMSANPRITPQYTEKQKWDTHYNLFITKKSNGEFVIENFKDRLIEDGIISKSETIHEDILLRKDFYKYIIKNKKNIARYVNSISSELKKLSLENPDKIVTISEDSNPVYAYNGSRISFLENAITVIKGEEKFSQLLGDLWTDIDFQNTQNEGGVSLPNGKKPEFLIQRLLSMFTKENDYVLDAYFGTGTTGAVAMKMGRRFIGIEQLDEHYNKAISRLQNVIEGEQSGISKEVKWRGGGAFTACELLDDNARFVKRIASSKNSDELTAIFDELLENPGVLNYNIKIDKVKNIRDVEFNALDIDLQKKILIALLDKNTLYINKTDIEDKEKNVSEIDIQFTKSFYGE